jgi:hypothetical protein
MDQHAARLRNKYQKFIDRYLERKLSPEYTNGNVINYINKEMSENDPNDYNDEFGFAINIISWTIQHFFPEYDLVNPDPVSIAKFIARLEQKNGVKEEFIGRLRAHYDVNLSWKFDKVNVAKRILEVYYSL